MKVETLLEAINKRGDEIIAISTTSNMRIFMNRIEGFVPRRAYVDPDIREVPENDPHFTNDRSKVKGKLGTLIADEQREVLRYIDESTETEMWLDFADVNHIQFLYNDAYEGVPATNNKDEGYNYKYIGGCLAPNN